MTAASRLADELLEIGRSRGLDGVGICDARPFDRTRDTIEDRKERGLHAGMQFTYRNPRRSTDPAATLPGAKSLVVGALSYRRTEPEVTEDPGATGATGGGPFARVARYSWSDYYARLREALDAVADRLVADGWRARVLVDDNALVDRAAAVRAGLGWYGKNTNVLIPGAGSWFVLGSVCTDAPVAPLVRPQPVADGCGGCRRCLVDCPTGALTAPGELDARRCLAWLLQAPGPFPPEFREALGDRLYGCDECQERCPVNRRVDHDPTATVAADPEAQVRVAVLDVLRASDAEIEAAVGRWYIPGREMRYVRRNALIVLGNIGCGTDPAVAAALAGALADADPIVRSHAVWASARLGRADLLEGLGGAEDPLVAEELARVGI